MSSERGEARTLAILPSGGDLKWCLRVAGRLLGELRKSTIDPVDREFAHAAVVTERTNLLHARPTRNTLLKFDRWRVLSISPRSMGGPKKRQ